MIDARAIEELFGWMVDGALPSTELREVVDQVCRTLGKAGIQIDRFALFIYTLDPSLIGHRFAWTPSGGPTVSEGKLGLFSTDEYTLNPLPRVVEERVSVRRRLCDPASPKDYMIIPELIDDGFTDYFVQPVIYTTGETNAVSWSTKQPGGFSDEAIAVLDRLNKPLARLTETYLLRINAANILSAYVGRNSGDQILRGKVHRGDGEEIDAAILFTDLVDFTAMSDALNGPQTVAILNDVFDVLVPPVADNGGEILKFLGDGFFAIFPYQGGHGLDRAVQAAGDAVASAEDQLAASSLGDMVHFRSAIHAGRFHYGNVGGANRLDFTAIGRPVNYTARLLQAGNELACNRVASDLAADHLGERARLIGDLPFKGFEGRQLIYTY